MWDLVCNVHIVNMGSQFILQHNYSQMQLIGKYNRLYCKALIVNCPIGGLSCIASPCLWLWLPLEGKPWTRATIVKKRIDLSQKLFYLLTKNCSLIIAVKSSEHAEVLLKAVPAITRSWWMRRWWRGWKSCSATTTRVILSPSGAPFTLPSYWSVLVSWTVSWPLIGGDSSGGSCLEKFASRASSVENGLGSWYWSMLHIMVIRFSTINADLVKYACVYI